MLSAWSHACAYWRDRDAVRVGLRHEVSARVTYAALDAAADSLATYLKHEGICISDRVGLGVGPSVAEVVALLACLKCQVVWIPLDPSSPWSSGAIAAKAGLRLVIGACDGSSDKPSQRASRKNGNEAYGVTGHVDCSSPPWLLLQASSGAVVGWRHGASLRPQVKPSSGLDGAWNIIFTSGSTGEPKGVVGRETAAVYRLRWMQTGCYSFLPQGEVILRRTPLVFVDAVWEIFGTLTAGATLMIPARTLAEDPLGFWATACDSAHGVTRMTLTPSLLATVLASSCLPPAIRYLLCSGEALSAALASDFFQVAPAGAKLLNLYGSTEVTGDVTCQELTRESMAQTLRDSDSLVPLGEPLEGTRLRIQEKAGWAEVSEEGAMGQLWVWGPAVAVGYYGEDVWKEERGFAMGDWVEVKGGKLWFRGRRDGVVKVRGVRIALEDVEARVHRALGAQHGSVLATVQTHSGDPADAALVVAITSEVAGARSWADIWSRLRSELSRSLVPSCIRIGNPGQPLPTTTTGKLDRRGLTLNEWWGQVCVPPPHTDGPVAVKTGSGHGRMMDDVSNWLEQRFVALTSGAPALPSTGEGLSLLARGGHSLIAMRALDEIRREFGVGLTVEDMGLGVVPLAELILRRSTETRGDRPVKRARRREEESEQLVLKKLWSVNLDKCIDGRPILVPLHGLAVVGSHAGVVIGVEPVSGKEVWRTKVGGRVEGTAALSSNGRCIHVGCYDTRLYSLDAISGRVLWSFATSGEIKCTPLVIPCGPWVCVGSYDGRLYVLKEHTGRVVATADTAGNLFAAPILLPLASITDGAVVARICTVSNGGVLRLWCLSTTGQPTMVRAVDIGCAVFGTPAVVGMSGLQAAHALIVVGGVDGKARGVSIAGETLWCSDLGAGPLFAPPTLIRGGWNAADVVFGAQDGSVHRIMATNGHVLWSHKQDSANGAITGPPLVCSISELLPVPLTRAAPAHADNRKLCLLATSMGQLVVLDADTGERLGGGAVSKERLSGVVAAEHCTVLVGSRDDHLYALQLEAGMSCVK